MVQGPEEMERQQATEDDDAAKLHVGPPFPFFHWQRAQLAIGAAAEREHRAAAPCCLHAPGAAWCTPASDWRLAWQAEMAAAAGASLAKLFTWLEERPTVRRVRSSEVGSHEATEDFQAHMFTIVEVAAGYLPEQVCSAWLQHLHMCDLACQHLALELSHCL